MKILAFVATVALALEVHAVTSLADAPWIGDGQPERDGADWYAEDPAPEFCAEFVLPAGVTETKIHFACAGFGWFAVNGAYMNADGLDTLWSAYDKTVYATTCAVRAKGKNTVTVRLGNGFYNLPPLKFWGSKCFRTALAHGRPCFKMTIDGVEAPLVWKWRRTNVIRNAVYLGAEVDATRPEDTDWKPAAAVKGPKGKIVEWLRTNPGMGCYDIHSGKTKWVEKKVKGRGEGEGEGEGEEPTRVQVVDFGVNASGVPDFTFVNEARGTKIEIVYGELLNADGTVNVLTQTAGQIKRGNGGAGAPKMAAQHDVYVCRGPLKLPPNCVVCDRNPNWERFSPPFTWHIFRYAEIRGAKNLVRHPSRNVRSMVSTESGLAPAAKAFRTDDANLKAIHEMCQRTFQANLIGGVQSDCPGRERLGYGGDIVATCEAMCLNFDMKEVYLKILRDFADEAADDGWITETAPYVGIADCGFGGRSGPIGWSLAVPVMMDAIIRHYPDAADRALAFYPVCARYVGLVAAKCPDGLIPNCIGDHEALERAPNGCTATALWYEFVRLTATFARRLGKSEEAARFEALAEKVKAAFRSKYVKGGLVANGTQSAQAIGLYLGLVPSDQVAAAEARLLKAVEEKGFAPTTGIFSTRYLLMYLSEHGYGDVARKIVLHEGFPGWRHMLDRGATTLWETWKESDDTYSNCHPMFGSVDEWILRFGKEKNETRSGDAQHEQGSGDFAELVRTDTPDWKPSVCWRGFNLLGMFRAPTIGLAPDPRVDGHFVEWEFRAIRDWGFNFVRLPIDYRILIRDDDWSKLDEGKMKHVDQAIAWGRQYGIHVQIALHRIPGYCILDQTEPFPLGTSPVAQEAASRMWAAFAKRWKDVPNETLSFNLFNEPTRHTAGANYFPLVKKLIAAIRAEDPSRFIMIDGNACASVPVPEVYGVPSVGQAFRGYTPQVITHYGADWMPQPKGEVTWPPKPEKGLPAWTLEMPEETLAKFAPALEAGECCMVGEFGCRNRTPHAVTLAWMDHCLKLWNSKNIGWALWNLRGHNGILDSGRTDVDYEDFEGHKLDRKMLNLLRRYAAPAKKADEPPELADARWIGAAGETQTAWRRDEAARARGVVNVKNSDHQIQLAHPLPKDTVQLRKTFALPAREVARATVAVTGQGFYELWLNGAKVEPDRVLAPCPWYDGAMRYDTYDVGRLLRSGAENTVGVWLSPGYSDDFSRWGWNHWLAPKRAILRIDIRFVDGTAAAVVSDGSWLSTHETSVPETSIYHGETVDARRGDPKWATAGAPTNGWSAVTVFPDGPELMRDEAPGVRAFDPRCPVSIRETEKGVYTVDFGQNRAGFVEVRAKGARGTRITVKTSEELGRDGRIDPFTNRRARSTDTFILAGTGGTESFRPRFTYHGFQYAEIRGYPGRLTADDVTGWAVGADLNPMSSFRCSNEGLMKLHNAAYWSMRSNLMGTPTDCSMRDERTFCLMDVQVYFDTACQMFDMRGYYKRAAALAEHLYRRDRMPRHQNPDWTGTTARFPFALYAWYGDRAALRVHYGLSRRIVDDYLSRAPDYDWASGYGDWSAPSPCQKWEDFFQDPGFVNAALLCRLLGETAEAARTLGRMDDAAAYAAHHVAAKAAFQKRYYHPETASYHTGSQRTYVLPLAWGIVPDNQRGRVGSAFVRRVRETDRSRLDTGIFSAAEIGGVLCELGEADLAVELMTQCEYPGFGFMFAQGGTTLWEQFKSRGSMNSHNHAMFAGAVSWFYTHLAGIRPAKPGYAEILVKPSFPKSVDWVEATRQTPRGEVRVSWKREGDAVRLSASVPPDIPATLQLPDGTSHGLKNSFSILYNG